MLQLAAIHAFIGCCQRPRKAKKKKEIDHLEIGSGQLRIVGLLTENCFQLEGLLFGHWGAVGRKYHRGIGLGNAVGELGPEICWVLEAELCWGTGKCCWGTGPELFWSTGARTLLGYSVVPELCWETGARTLLGYWGQNSVGELGSELCWETDLELLFRESAGELETDVEESGNCCRTIR